MSKTPKHRSDSAQPSASSVLERSASFLRTQYLTDIFKGQRVLTRPFPSVTLLPNEQGFLRAGVPTMFVGAAVRNEQEEVIAALGLRIVPAQDFTRILDTARSGASGETYAFDMTGLMLSESRFMDQLKELALLPDTPEACSILTLALCDPGVDLRVDKPEKRRAELPFIKPVAEIRAGRDGQDVNGYRDYRGVPVVGVWYYLPELDVGLVTQIDKADAFAPLRVMRGAFWFLFGLLTLGSVVVFVLMRVAVALAGVGSPSHDGSPSTLLLRDGVPRRDGSRSIGQILRPTA